jgi:flagellar motor switch protein FliG
MTGPSRRRRTSRSRSGRSSNRLDPARLAAIVGVEHPQTVALILSQIAPSAAAKVVVLLEKSLRGDVVKRMLSLAPVSHAAKAMVEGQLRARLAAETNTKDDSAGTKRVANLLNELDRGDLDEVMADLEEAGSTAIDKLRAQLFSFEDIVLLTQKARVSLFDGLPTDQVTNALRNADPQTVEAILSALGARSRRMIESELASGSDNVSADEISRARKSIASAAIRMAQDGAFELPQRQEAA